MKNPVPYKCNEMVSKIPILVMAACCLSCGRTAKTPAKTDSSVLDPIVARQELTQVFSGDVMQHLPQVEAARQPDGSFDYTSCFRYIRPFWESADFASGNLETT